jgi:hypothetical protein
MQQQDLLRDENWAVIESLLPEGWEDKAKELGAYQRKRAFAGSGELLRTLLIHVAEGCSFRVTAALAEESGLADVSDVALNKRLRLAGEWFRWLAVGVIGKWLRPEPLQDVNGLSRAKLADATTVQEPGSKGTSWRIHYCMDLCSLRCDEVKITGPQGAESFSQFTVQPGDLWIGDRGYAQRSGIHHVVSHGGDVLVRSGVSSMVLEDEKGDRFDLLGHLRTLKHSGTGDWQVTISHEGCRIFGRICAIRKSENAIKRTHKKILRDNAKKGRKTKPDTLEAAKYIFVFTTLDPSIPAETILIIYRMRWQIELAFKRLKSLLKMGHLHNKNPESAKAWIYGKLLTACLVEALGVAAARFFPWGYPIRASIGETAKSVERDSGNVPLLSPGPSSN